MLTNCIEGLKSKDDYVKLMNTLASKNPDEKIKATAALDNSQKRALNLDSDLTYDAGTNINETTTDLKFCSVYGYRGTVKPVLMAAS
jgi:hypothetical protein